MGLSKKVDEKDKKKDDGKPKVQGPKKSYVNVNWSLYQSKKLCQCKLITLSIYCISGSRFFSN